jgi:DNA-directed RNA polymerase specialized sigma24 family protein
MIRRADIEQRLECWRAWYHAGQRPGPPRVISWWGPMILDRNVAQSWRERTEAVADPTEAQLTDWAVRQLRPTLRNAVTEIYIKGGTMEQKARAQHCDRTTLYHRIERAHRELEVLLDNFSERFAAIMGDISRGNIASKKIVLQTPQKVDKNFYS